MKRLLFGVSMLLVGVSAFAQGTLSFSNRTSLGDWKVALLLSGIAAGLSPSPIAVNIFLADPSGGAPSGSSLGATTFRQTPAAAAFFVVPIDEIVVAGLAPGSSAQRFVAQFTVGNGLPSYVRLVINPNSPAGGGSPPAPPGELLPADPTLLGGTLYVGPMPEPSTIALGILGGAVLLLRRRGKASGSKP
jgi:hypothetical protein